MGVHKNSIHFPSASGSVTNAATASAFGNQATGFTTGFGRQTNNNTVFGTFSNQNNQQSSNNSSGFGSQHIFGNNSFHNTGFHQPFGFGCMMSQQTTTNICFTGFGEPKTNYCFTNSSSPATLKKVTLVFEHPDVIFGSSMFKKPDTIVEIEAHPLNSQTWLWNNNDFSFCVGHIEKLNSIFIMKSPKPIKLSVKVKQPGYSFSNIMSSSMNYENRKITLSFQSDQPQYIPNTNIQRPLETIVEIPLPIVRYDPVCTFLNEDFMFSVGPSGGVSNSFEVQTSKNAVFKITFGEAGICNRNQLFRMNKMNAFPSKSGQLFGSQAASAFGANKCFGSSTTGQTSNQPAFGANQVFGSSTNGQTSNQPSVFGANQVFGNSTTGQTSNQPFPFGSNQVFGSSTSGQTSNQPSPFGAKQVFGSLTTGQTSNQPSPFGSNQVFGSSTTGQISNQASPFGSNQVFGGSTSGQTSNKPSPFGAKQVFGSSTTGQTTNQPTPFGSNQVFGSSTTGQTTNQPTPFGSNQVIGGSTSGQTSNKPSPFGSNKVFGSSTTGQTSNQPSAFSANQIFGSSISGQTLNQPSASGANQIFGSSTTGQTSNQPFPFGSNQVFGSSTSGQTLNQPSAFGANQIFGSSTTGQTSNQPSPFGSKQVFGSSTTGQISNQPSPFGSNQVFGSSTTGQTSNQPSPFGSNQVFGSSTTGQTSNQPSPFGSNQVFGSSTTGQTWNQPSPFGSNQVFGSSTTGQTSNKPSPFGAKQVFGSSTTGQTSNQPSPFGAKQVFGSSTTGQTSNQPSPFGSNQVFGSSTTGQTSNQPSPFGAKQVFGSSTTGQTTNRPTPFGSNQVFGSSTTGQTSNQPSPFGSNQVFGSSTTGQTSNQPSPFGSNQVFGSSTTGQTSNQRSAFGANQVFGSATTRQTSNPTSTFSGNQCVGSSNHAQPINSNQTQTCFFGKLPTNQKTGGTLGYTVNQSFECLKKRNDGINKFGTNDQSLFKDNKDLTSVHYQPTLGSDVLQNHPGRVETKTHCITAMNEYSNASLEELRYQDYIRNSTSCELPNESFEELRHKAYMRKSFSESPLKENNVTTNSGCKTNELAILNGNTFVGCSPSHEKIIGNKTNQAFFDQLHQLIPYLNAGSFCKCVNAQKHLHNDNEFYQDVFKYLEHIQKQCRQLECTLDKKSANDMFPEDHSCKPIQQKNTTDTTKESNKSLTDVKTQKSSMLVCGISTNSASANTNFNEDRLQSEGPVPENDVPSVEKVSCIFDCNEEANKSLLFGTDVSNINAQSTASKALEAATAIIQNLIKSENSDKAKNNKINQSEDHSNKSKILKSNEADSTQHTQKLPMFLFGNSNNSVVNNSLTESSSSSINPDASEKKGSNIFGPSVFPAAGTTLSTSGITENIKSNNNSLKSTESLVFSKDFNAINMPKTTKPLDLDKSEETKTEIFSSIVTSVKPANMFDSVLMLSLKDNSSSSSLEAEKSKSKKPDKKVIASTKVERYSSGKVGMKVMRLCPLHLPSSKRFPKLDSPSISENISSILPFCGSIKMPDKTTNSSSTEGHFTGFSTLNFPSIKPAENFTGSIFSTKDNTLEKKSTSPFSGSSQIPEVKLNYRIFSTKDSIFNKNMEAEKSIGFFPFVISSDKTDNTNEIESTSKKNSDVTKPQENEGNFQKESDNGCSFRVSNFGKAGEPLFLPNDNKIQGEEKQIVSIKQIDESMNHVQDDFVSSQVFKMKKISEILAEINEKAATRKESLNESDTDSDISNYSLISNRSSNKDEKDKALVTRTEEHPTGIVLKRYGYYILPTLDDLKSQITQDGACIVPNFTIGRKGYGSVYFNKEINVADLNVDDLVHFRNKEIIIYPNDSTKPDVIAYLKNYDVLVTLEQVWPYDRTKHKPIKDPQLLDEIKFKDKLRLVCHKNDVDFIDYLPKTGSWLFKMKQFSKNNISFWDLEDDHTYCRK